MRVPVLVVLPKHPALTESAVAAQPLDVAAAPAPAGVELDAAYRPVPLGVGTSGPGMALEAMAADASETFAVRGFVEAESHDQVPESVDGKPLFADPQIAPLITCGSSPPVGKKADVEKKLNVAALQAKHLDGTGVAVAIMDTGINLAHLTSKLGFTPALDAANSWNPPGVAQLPGQHPVGHGTMCSYDVMIAAPKATLLDFSVLATTAPGGSVVGRTLSIALLGFSQLLTFWAVAFAPGGAPKYKALVSSNSWGIFHPSWDFPAGHPGRYIDNPNHPFHIIVAALTRFGADVTFAAGNCGKECPDGRCQGRTTQAIMGASTYQEVLTLAGCDTQDHRVGYSSQGPSIPPMFAHKPDVTSYTHFLGSEAFGPNTPDSGTSAACPVAAGCIAALRSSTHANAKPSATTPAQMIATIHGTARHAGPPGWNPDLGFGIIDPVAVAAKLNL